MSCRNSSRDPAHWERLPNRMARCTATGHARSPKYTAKSGSERMAHGPSACSRQGEGRSSTGMPRDRGDRHRFNPVDPDPAAGRRMHEVEGLRPRLPRPGPEPSQPVSGVGAAGRAGPRRLRTRLCRCSVRHRSKSCTEGNSRTRASRARRSTMPGAISLRQGMVSSARAPHVRGFSTPLGTGLVSNRVAWPLSPGAMTSPARPFKLAGQPSGSWVRSVRHTCSRWAPSCPATQNRGQPLP